MRYSREGGLRVPVRIYYRPDGGFYIFYCIYSFYLNISTPFGYRPTPICVYPFKYTHTCSIVYTYTMPIYHFNMCTTVYMPILCILYTRGDYLAIPFVYTWRVRLFREGRKSNLCFQSKRECSRNMFFFFIVETYFNPHPL